MGRPAQAGIAWPVGRMMSGLQYLNPSVHLTGLAVRQASEVELPGRQLSPLTVPPPIAVFIDTANPSPLLRNQWSKLP